MVKRDLVKRCVSSQVYHKLGLEDEWDVEDEEASVSPKEFAPHLCHPLCQCEKCRKYQQVELFSKFSLLSTISFPTYCDHVCISKVRLKSCVVSSSRIPRHLLIVKLTSTVEVLMEKLPCILRLSMVLSKSPMCYSSMELLPILQIITGNAHHFTWLASITTLRYGTYLQHDHYMVKVWYHSHFYSSYIHLKVWYISTLVVFANIAAFTVLNMQPFYDIIVVFVFNQVKMMWLSFVDCITFTPTSC